MEDLQDWCGICGDTRLFIAVSEAADSETDYACVDCGAAVLVPATPGGHTAVA